MKAVIFGNYLKSLINSTKSFIGGLNCTPCHQCIRLEFNNVDDTVTAIATNGRKLSIESKPILCADENFIAYIKPPFPKILATDIAFIEVVNKQSIIKIGESVATYDLPESSNSNNIDDCFNYRKALEDIERKTIVYKIAFNPDLLIDSLRAAKASNTKGNWNRVVLEFRSPLDPVILKHGQENENIKLFFPMPLDE